MRLADLNALDDDAAAATFLRCCGSSRWARQMAAARPFASAGSDGAEADAIWPALDRAGLARGVRGAPADRRDGGRRAAERARMVAATSRPASPRPQSDRARLADGQPRLRGPLRLHFHRLRDRQDAPARCSPLLEQPLAA